MSGPEKIEKAKSNKDAIKALQKMDKVLDKKAKDRNKNAK